MAARRPRGHRSIGHRRGSRRWLAWFAVFALLCQAVLPFGHHSLAEEMGEDCPGLHLVSAGDQDADQARQASDQSTAKKHERCPVCQLMRHSGTFATLTTIILPPERFDPPYEGIVPVIVRLAVAATHRPETRAPPQVI